MGITFAYVFVLNIGLTVLDQLKIAITRYNVLPWSHNDRLDDIEGCRVDKSIRSSDHADSFSSEERQVLRFRVVYDLKIPEEKIIQLIYWGTYVLVGG